MNLFLVSIVTQVQIFHLLSLLQKAKFHKIEFLKTEEYLNLSFNKICR